MITNIFSITKILPFFHKSIPFVLLDQSFACQLMLGSALTNIDTFIHYLADDEFFLKRQTFITIICALSNELQRTSFIIGVFLVIISLVCAILVTISYFRSLRIAQNVEKKAVYECGFTPLDLSTRAPFNVHYFRVGILFIILDVEVGLLYPYIVTLQEQNGGSTACVLFFLIVLTAGFLYEGTSGALAGPTRFEEKKVTPSADDRIRESANPSEKRTTPLANDFTRPAVYDAASEKNNTVLMTVIFTMTVFLYELISLYILELSLSDLVAAIILFNPFGIITYIFDRPITAVPPFSIFRIGNGTASYQPKPGELGYGYRYFRYRLRPNQIMFGALVHIPIILAIAAVIALYSVLFDAMLADLRIEIREIREIYNGGYTRTEIRLPESVYYYFGINYHVPLPELTSGQHHILATILVLPRAMFLSYVQAKGGFGVAVLAGGLNVGYLFGSRYSRMVNYRGHRNMSIKVAKDLIAELERPSQQHPDKGREDFHPLIGLLSLLFGICGLYEDFSECPDRHAIIYYPIVTIALLLSFFYILRGHDCRRPRGGYVPYQYPWFFGFLGFYAFLMFSNRICIGTRKYGYSLKGTKIVQFEDIKWVENGAGIFPGLIIFSVILIGIVYGQLRINWILGFRQSPYGRLNFFNLDHEDEYDDITMKELSHLGAPEDQEIKHKAKALRGKYRANKGLQPGRNRRYDKSLTFKKSDMPVVIAPEKPLRKRRRRARDRLEPLEAANAKNQFKRRISFAGQVKTMLKYFIRTVVLVVLIDAHYCISGFNTFNFISVFIKLLASPRLGLPTKRYGFHQEFINYLMQLARGSLRLPEFHVMPHDGCMLLRSMGQKPGPFNAVYGLLFLVPVAIMQALSFLFAVARFIRYLCNPSLFAGENTPESLGGDKDVRDEVEYLRKIRLAKFLKYKGGKLRKGRLHKRKLRAAKKELEKKAKDSATAETSTQPTTAEQSSKAVNQDTSAP